jgi:hypothetical protein
MLGRIRQGGEEGEGVIKRGRTSRWEGEQWILAQEKKGE